MSTDLPYDGMFPYDSPRESQITAIDYAMEQFVAGKKIVIIEAGTGVGKSAIGLTIARKLQALLGQSGEFGNGSYFLTTQKILQDQYVNDFGSKGGRMKSIKSSSNYDCASSKGMSCAEGLRALKTIEKDSSIWKRCTFNCNYRNAKTEFVESPEGVTNFSYFLAETQYSGKLKPRNVLVIDEAHNASLELSKFVEITMTDRFSKSMLKLDIPHLSSQAQAHAWVRDTYAPKLKSYIRHIESMMEKYSGLKDKIKEFAAVAKQFELLDKHTCKINRFLEIYDDENWIYNIVDADGKKSRRLEFKPIDVSMYANDMLFKWGNKVLMMSATILDIEGTCALLGLKRDEVGFISIPSPFPVENRPVISASIGKMSAEQIETTLPNLAKAIEAILEQHKGDKGIIHCHTFRIANYLKKNIKNKRLLMHDSDNRDDVLEKHLKSKSDTVLLSPSMTEGIDLHGDNSRFQVICKVPYPYLGDKLVKKRMSKWKWWYPLQTAKTIVQAAGRSIRSADDHAITYILDSDWEHFYNKNILLFPPGFRDSVK